MSRKHIIARLKEDSNYQEFFKNAMLKFGIESIADVDDSKKSEFFDYIEKNWTKEKNESALRKKIKLHIKEVVNEMTGLNKKFDAAISKYKALLLKKQKTIEEFLTSYNAEKDPKKQDTLKKKHIENMNKLKKDLTDAEIQYKTAIQNLAPAEADELLEHKKK